MSVSNIASSILYSVILHFRMVLRTIPTFRMTVLGSFTNFKFSQALLRADLFLSVFLHFWSCFHCYRERRRWSAVWLHRVLEDLWWCRSLLLSRSPLSGWVVGLLWCLLRQLYISDIVMRGNSRRSWGHVLLPSLWVLVSRAYMVWDCVLSHMLGFLTYCWWGYSSRDWFLWGYSTLSSRRQTAWQSCGSCFVSGWYDRDFDQRCAASWVGLTVWVTCQLA